MESSDEFLIPKINNVNVDKSIETINKTIINFLKMDKINY